MNKIKDTLAGFAIFASIMMLSTTCIARPVEQEASIEALEYAQQELINSIEAMAQEALNDPYVIKLMAPLKFDNELNSLVSAIDNANDPNEKAALARSYFDVLKDKEEFTDLKAYLTSSNLDGIKNINSKLNAFADTAGDCLINADSEIGSPMVFPPMPRFFLIELEPDGSEGTETQDGEDSNTGDTQTTGIGDILDELIELIINLIALIAATVISLLNAIAEGAVWLIEQITAFLNVLNEWLEELLRDLFGG